MRKLIRSFIVFAIVIISSLPVCAQQTIQNQQDPCSELRFMALLNEAPTISVTDVRNLPQCFNGKFIQLVGIYRVAFENSDLYDPIGNEGSTWVSFDPFYSAVKRCSSPQALKLLDREKGGTFGFVAMGVFHGPEPYQNVDPKLPAPIRERLERSLRRYGHMGGWDNEFQVICLENLVDFSDSGALLEYQKPNVRKRILEWYAKNLPK